MDKKQRKQLIGGILSGIPYLERSDLLSMAPDSELASLHDAVRSVVDAIRRGGNCSCTDS